MEYSYYVSDMPELYNLKENPQEMRDLALLPRHQGRVKEMQAQLLAWYKPPESGVKPG